jgi:hypothetical protein
MNRGLQRPADGVLRGGARVIHDRPPAAGDQMMRRPKLAGLLPSEDGANQQHLQKRAEEHDHKERVDVHVDGLEGDHEREVVGREPGRVCVWVC